jgi:hypothetical protein
MFLEGRNFANLPAKMKGDSLTQKVNLLKFELGVV